jgi:hypothetical protein
MGAAALALAGGLAASSAEAYPWVQDWRHRKPVEFTPVPGVVVPVRTVYGEPYPPAFGPASVCFEHHRVWNWRDDRHVWVTRTFPC